MSTDRAITRRSFSSLVLAASGAALVGCDTTSEKNPEDTGDPTGGDDSTTGDDTGAVDTGPVDTGSVEWATGGTASMSGDYADPFEDDSTECALMCAMTLGPCYAETPERKDVSEGYSGLPMRLALRLLDSSCQPIEGALVEIWHTSPSGLYSGDDTAEMCTTGDALAESTHWFRGGQVSDADGRVDFDSCFPGWYASRAIHIHIQVLLGGEEYLVSQLFFEQALIDEIFAVHPEYSVYGPPAVSNAADGVLAGIDATPYTVTTSKLSDGALMAYKTIVIRASLVEELCDA